MVPWAHLTPQPNSMSISSAIFAGLTSEWQTNHTDRQTTLIVQ